MEDGAAAAPVIMLGGPAAEPRKRARPAAAAVIPVEISKRTVRPARRGRRIPRRQRNNGASLPSTRTSSVASVASHESKCIYLLSGVRKRRAAEILALREQRRQCEPTGEVVRMEDIFRQARQAESAVVRTLDAGRQWQQRYEARFPETVDGNMEKIASSVRRSKMGRQEGARVTVVRNGKVVADAACPDGRSVAERSLRKFYAEREAAAEKEDSLVRDPFVKANSFGRHKRRKVRSLVRQKRADDWKARMEVGAFALMEEKRGVF